jgi:hypothetical protein
MSESKYKCQYEIVHALVPSTALAGECESCVTALREKYDAMLEFINKLAFDYHDYENENEISWDATELLQKIGELKNV